MLEIPILMLRNFIKLPVLRYLSIYNVLSIWSARAIPKNVLQDRLYYEKLSHEIFAIYGINVSQN